MDVGVLVGCHFNMTNHTKQVCRQSLDHLKNLFRIRNVLTQKVTETLIHTFIITRLDYCNA